MSLQITLDDAAINASRLQPTAAHQKVIQSSDYLPIVVDLSSQITLGLAILTAIAADDLLWDQFNEAKEKDILAAITSIAIVAPAEAVEIRAYISAGVHVRSAPIGDITYIPVVRLYRNYVLGGGTLVTLDVTVAV